MDIIDLSNLNSDSPDSILSQGVKRSCSFYVAGKKRQCRMIPMKGRDTCAEHSIKGVDPRQERVSCPLDPKHTVFAYMLKKHLTKCNARKTESLHPFYSFGINSGDTASGLQGLSLNELDDTQLMALIEKIRAAKAHITETHLEIGSSEVVQAEIDNPLNGNEAKRHLRQTSSILQILEKEDCLAPNTCFIEFGSGKGGLTYWVAQAVQALPNPETQSFILIDRTSPRHKRDNKLQETEFKVERIRIDIKDLKLDEVSLVRKSTALVGISKHLCGAATDLALRCLLESNSLSHKVVGFVFATCCHHQCTWDSFVGKESLLEWGFTKEDFRPLTCITSWNVCGTGTGKFNKDSADTNSQKYSKLNLNLEERRLIGGYAKRLLDNSRCEYVRRHGLSSRSTMFVSSDDTYENVCIIGLKKPTDLELRNGNPRNGDCILPV